MLLAEALFKKTITFTFGDQRQFCAPIYIIREVGMAAHKLSFVHFQQG